MKLFIVFVFAAAANAKPSGVISPVVYSAPVPISSPVSTQYHSQDELGQYSYGYSNEHSAKSEARSVNGVTVGGYTYVDPEGKLQTVEYLSDVNGFRVAASNLPVPPPVQAVPAVSAPDPVQDTPEVVEARVKHLEAVEAAKVRSAEVIASIPVISNVVHSISPVAAAPSATLVATPLEAAAPIVPLVAAKSSEAVTTSSESSSEASSSSINVKEAPVSSPAIQPKTANSPSSGSPAIIPSAVSILPSPTIGVLAPALRLGVAPIVPAATAYSINSLYPFGFSSVVAQPAFTAYTTQFVSSLQGPVEPKSEASTPSESSEQRNE